MIVSSCCRPLMVIDARLAAGGIAPVPWRLSKSEAALLGRKPDLPTFTNAADLAIEGARALSQNGFKIELLRSAVIRSLQSSLQRSQQSSQQMIGVQP